MSDLLTNPTACAGCATPLPVRADACPACGGPVGRQLRTWTSPSAWVTAVEWADGPRVVKLLKNLDDQWKCVRLRREAETLAGLAGQVPAGSVPELLASGRGVVVTRFVPGVTVQELLQRGHTDRSLAVAAAGRTVAALHAACPVEPRRAESGGLIPDLEAVEDLFPAWVLEAATGAGSERSTHPTLVHGDCVPSNWLWDGERVCLLDFAQLRFGSPEFDPALAWARLRLLGGGLRNGLGRRLSSIVLEPPWPATNVAWLANALVIIAWYDRVRFADARPGLRQAREAVLRVTVGRAVRELADRRPPDHRRRGRKGSGMPSRRVRERTDYRVGWRSHEAALAYEKDLHREESETGWLNEIERRVLTEVVNRQLGGREIRYLDFACGTGRIIAFLEERVGSATGIDASPEMLELARTRLTKAKLICGDVTTDPAVLPGRYDLITAFRFFLNAGETLRGEVLKILHQVLADDGILVFNLHSNAWSLRALSVLYRRHVLRQAWWNQRSFRQVRRELRAHGFRVVELHGYNFLTGKGSRLLPAAAIPRIERALARVRPLRYLGVHLLFVCRKAPPPPQRARASRSTSRTNRSSE